MFKDGRYIKKYILADRYVYLIPSLMISINLIVFNFPLISP